MAKKTDAPEFDPRRADEPGQVYDYHDTDGSLVTVKADDDGIVRPTSEAEKRAVDAFSLPVARKAIADEKAAADAGKEHD